MSTAEYWNAALRSGAPRERISGNDPGAQTEAQLQKKPSSRAPIKVALYDWMKYHDCIPYAYEKGPKNSKENRGVYLNAKKEHNYRINILTI